VALPDHGLKHWEQTRDAHIKTGLRLREESI